VSSADAQRPGSRWAIALVSHLAPIGLALIALASVAGAQGFPSRVVTIVSPYQAGGTSDIIARALAKALTDRWGQSVIVENRPGANGGIGVTAVAHAAADGHTMLAVASSALTLNPVVYKSLSYDVGRDLAPVTRTGTVANVLVVNPSVPARTVAELIALAKAKPGALTYASQGIGSNGHVTGELFRQRAGIDIVHVPYKGSAPAVQDLIGGQVQIMFDNLPSVLPQIKAGLLRAIAVTTAVRSAALPDVPTIAESGLPGFDTSAWFALLLPKGVPEAVRGEVERSVVAVLQTPQVREPLRAAGIEVAADGSAALAKRIDAETQVWRDVVGKAGIKVE
jgi:tripartite-type tricarboxylate transporter receptor subunit TctC